MTYWDILPYQSQQHRTGTRQAVAEAESNQEDYQFCSFCAIPYAVLGQF